MNARERLQQLRLRQLELQLRSAELRAGMAAEYRQLAPAVGWVDRGWALLRRLRESPPLLQGGAGLAGLWATFSLLRRPGRWARAWALFTTGRRLWRWWRGKA